MRTGNLEGANAKTGMPHSKLVFNARPYYTSEVYIKNGWQEQLVKRAFSHTMQLQGLLMYYGMQPMMVAYRSGVARLFFWGGNFNLCFGKPVGPGDNDDCK